MAKHELITEIYLKPRPKLKPQFFRKSQRAKAIDEYDFYKRRIREEVQVSGLNLLEERTLKVVFHFRIPASYSIERKERMLNSLHIDSPNLGDLIEAVTDALFNDMGVNNLHTIIARKIWSEYNKIVIYRDENFQLNKKKEIDYNKKYFDMI